MNAVEVEMTQVRFHQLRHVERCRGTAKASWRVGVIGSRLMDVLDTFGPEGTNGLAPKSVGMK
jgi:hypothetical protein